MNDIELSERLKELSCALFGGANSYAINDGVKKLLAFLEAVNPGEYRLLYRSLYNRDATVKAYEPLCMPLDRLERLAIRLEDEGRYTDSDICWLFLKEKG